MGPSYEEKIANTQINQSRHTAINQTQLPLRSRELRPRLRDRRLAGEVGGREGRRVWTEAGGPWAPRLVLPYQLGHLLALHSVDVRLRPFLHEFLQEVLDAEIAGQELVRHLLGVVLLLLRLLPQLLLHVLGIHTWYHIVIRCNHIVIVIVFTNNRSRPDRMLRRESSPFSYLPLAMV